MNYFTNYVETVASSLRNMAVTDRSETPLTQEEGLARWCDLTREMQQADRTMYFTGNGASAAMSGHMSADASKNGGIRSQAFNEISLMTAVSNDIAYDRCFAEPLKRFARAGDILVTISSSGNSPNIIRAIETARECDVQVITLSGMKPENRSKAMGDLNFYIPAHTYGIVEVAHQAVLHCWLDRFMEEI